MKLRGSHIADDLVAEATTLALRGLIQHETAAYTRARPRGINCRQRSAAGAGARLSQGRQVDALDRRVDDAQPPHVSTIVDKADDVDRTTTKRRIKLGLPTKPRPKRRKWSLSHLPKRATELVEQARELDKEAKGLGRVRAGN